MWKRHAKRSRKGGSGLEELFQFLERVPGASFPAPVSELEELAEVRPVLLDDALGRAFAAFVVGCSIVEPAVEADLYVRAAPGAALAPAGPALNLYSPLAMEAFCHERYFNTGREKNKPARLTEGLPSHIQAHI